VPVRGRIRGNLHETLRSGGADGLAAPGMGRGSAIFPLGVERGREAGESNSPKRGSQRKWKLRAKSYGRGHGGTRRRSWPRTGRRFSRKAAKTQRGIDHRPTIPKNPCALLVAALPRCVHRWPIILPEDFAPSRKSFGAFSKAAIPSRNHRIVYTYATKGIRRALRRSRRHQYCSRSRRARITSLQPDLGRFGHKAG